MKNWPAPLLTMLATRGALFAQADLYTITLTDSNATVLRYTTAPIDILAGGNVFSSAWLYIDDKGNRSQAHMKVGLDVDTWVVHMSPEPTNPFTGASSPATILGQPWLAAVAAGVIQGATVQIDRAYWAGGWPQLGAALPVSLTDPSGKTLTDVSGNALVQLAGSVGVTLVAQYVGDHIFLGRVAAVDVLRNRAVITINSHLELLTTLAPINVFQANCRHTLFDAGCALSQAAFATATNGVLAPLGQGTPQNPLYTTFPAGIPGSGTLTLGQILFTSGANKGFRRGVRQMFASGGQFGLILIAPLYFPVGLGDTFTAYPGCDKTYANSTGCAGFSNQPNYGGQLTVPIPETAV